MTWPDDFVNKVIHSDCLDVMKEMPDESVNCCVTSPPYWGLRDYGVDGQLGLEKTPGEYVEKMVVIFRELKRILRGDGTVFLNLGDSYMSGGPRHTGRNDTNRKTPGGRGGSFRGGDRSVIPCGISGKYQPKPKDLVGIPWRVAFALQADGWYLRSDIIWSKPNPMPESVTDRPTKSHEYIFLLSKSGKYYYDAEAIKESPTESTLVRIRQRNFSNQAGGPKDGINPNRSMRRALENLHKKDKQRGHSRRHSGFNDRWDSMTKEEQGLKGRNKRSVWTIATQPYAEAHFATFPEKLIEPCILAGCPEGGIVIDPFIGSGTTAKVAQEMKRNFIGIELNEEYIPLIENRTAQGVL